MGRNRLKTEGGPSLRARLGTGARWAWRLARPALLVTLALTAIGGIGYAGWRAVLRSPYFTVRSVDVPPTVHLTRAEVVRLIGLEGPRNLFDFDPREAGRALSEHPWIAKASVTKRLPNEVAVHIVEREAAGVLVLDQLYLVDGTGLAFALADSNQASRQTLVTGLDRGRYEDDPKAAQAAVREALAVARRYALSPLADPHPLSNVHLGEGGRIELQLGKTRVVLGQGNWNNKLAQLGRIFDRLNERNMDAAYILLSEDLDRAIVKEVPRASAISARLRVVKPEGAGDR
ncbi:MAG: FtsQ-type POTRA domain-containing protein [Myxococcales bacterium]|nr:FtsQ-type POTRA domain-containing protein [Myxococcales bacterium]MCB9523283.1 FtsQ-type POTRA domain-containing protein [Myxococcales bacterium]